MFWVAINKLKLDLNGPLIVGYLRGNSGADPEIFAEDQLKIYLYKRFCTIFPFTLIALGATSHNLLLRNKFLNTGCYSSLTWRVARNLQWIVISGSEPQSMEGIGVLGAKLPPLRDFAIFFCKNNLILGQFW